MPTTRKNVTRTKWTIMKFLLIISECDPAVER